MSFRRSASPLRVYVGGIGDGVTEGDLYSAFASVGVPLDHVELVVNRATGCLRGFAFVVVAAGPKGAAPGANTERVLWQMRSAAVCGRPVTVQAIAVGLAPRPIHGPTAPERRLAEYLRSRAGQARQATIPPPL